MHAVRILIHIYACTQARTRTHTLSRAYSCTRISMIDHLRTHCISLPTISQWRIVWCIFLFNIFYLSSLLNAYRYWDACQITLAQSIARHFLALAIILKLHWNVCTNKSPFNTYRLWSGCAHKLWSTNFSKVWSVYKIIWSVQIKFGVCALLHIWNFRVTAICF